MMQPSWLSSAYLNDHPPGPRVLWGPMSVPGTAADVSTSYYDSISTVPGTGPRVRGALSQPVELVG